jgi:hypothetical protein
VEGVCGWGALNLRYRDASPFSFYEKKIVAPMKEDNIWGKSYKVYKREHIFTLLSFISFNRGKKTMNVYIYKKSLARGWVKNIHQIIGSLLS